MKSKIIAVAFGVMVSLTGTSANASCYSACQEILRDCIAQGGGMAFCTTLYRDCLEGPGCSN